jgi:hypothetical protein
MKTSCFKEYTGDNGVAVCLYPPIDWTGAQFPGLAPTRDIFYSKKSGKIDEKEYEKRYREEVLSKLNPEHIYNMFKDYVLLCWETPLFDKNKNIINSGKNFCHRHIIAKWLNETINVTIYEWTLNNEKIKRNFNPLF